MDFKTFIKDYWQIIAYCLIALLFLVINIIIKRKKGISLLDAVKETALEELPLTVLMFEEDGLEGEAKMAKVLGYTLARISKLIGKELSQDEINYWTSWIKARVENILSAPQKKAQIEVKEAKKNVYRVK